MISFPTGTVHSTTTTEIVSLQHRWTIDNFSYHQQQIGEKSVTTPFSAESHCSVKWSLQLYPSGVDGENEDSIGLYLHLNFTDKENLSVAFRACILNSQGIETYTMHTDGFCDIAPKEKIGFNRFLHRKTIFKDSNVLSDDTLIIISYITAKVDRINSRNEIESLNSLTSDMEDLLEDKKYSDVFFEIGDQKYFAHRAILTARSPFLRKLFKKYENEMPDYQTRVAELQMDEKSAEVMPEVLSYIYTGKINQFEKKVNLRLLKVASFLELERLQIMCLHVLTRKMTAKNVSGFLSTVCSLGLYQAKEQAIRFIRANALNVLNTQEWNKLVEESPHIVKVIFPSFSDIDRKMA